MAIIKHKFRKCKLESDIQILIIGTFNPDTPENIAEFFYGRQRNFLWRLLPVAFCDESLKNKDPQRKIEYIKEKRIGFIDLIAEVDVSEVANYDDAYLDSKVNSWRKVISEIQTLDHLKKVCFTRKTFAGIPVMKTKIEEIRTYCETAGIQFKYLTTPARFYSAAKQEEWTLFLNDNATRIKL
jgi:G:T/U-mismatch repair DNA glycosylase